MERAAVLIGVSRTGGLTALQAVESGVEAMSAWAAAQRIRPERVIRLTDADGGAVTASQIKAAIRGLCEQGSVEQLVLYFAGHGVNIRYGEYWLLSGAPDDTQEAVNVAGSVELARHCGIGHVVIVSDACRTAPSGINAQNVTGSEVFPNVGAAGPERPVDIFFAATLGHESLEVKDPLAAAARYRGVFTESLVSALSGQQAEVIERLDGVSFVRPRPLKRFLMRDVDRRLRAAKVALTVFQEPDARITSDEDAWLSRLSLPAPPVEPAMPGASGPQGGEGGEVSAHVGEVAEPEDDGDHPAQRSRRMLRQSLGMGPATMPGAEREDDVLPGGTDTMAKVEAPFSTALVTGPAGFVVRGARVVAAESWQATVRMVNDDLVSVDDLDARAAADVLLTFDDGSAAVLPALTGFAGVLTFHDGELQDVALSPTESSLRYPDYRAREGELRALRGVIAASSRLGLFRLEGEEADVLARRMQLAKGIDPTLALYAAYAYDDLRRTDRLAEMAAALRADLGIDVFDVAMLNGDLDGKAPMTQDDVFPSTPMLSRGWATLRARGIRLDPAYDGIEAHLLPSLWTLLDADGASMARDALTHDTRRTP